MPDLAISIQEFLRACGAEAVPTRKDLSAYFIGALIIRIGFCGPLYFS